MSVSDSLNDEKWVRMLAFVAVGILLNFGLFFVLSIVAPVIAGIVSGYFINEYKAGTLSGLLSAIAAYSTIFVVMTIGTTGVLIITSAVLIMGLLGTAGGALGVFLHSLNRSSMN